MRLEATYGRLRLAAMAVGLLVALQGCIWDGPLEETASGGSSYHMSVTVVTGVSASTRADHADDFEENGSAAENFIDFDNGDFRVILFDKEGNFLHEVGGDAEWSIISTTDGEGQAYYLLESEIPFPEDYPEARLEFLRNNGFQVMVLANWRSVDPDRTGDAYENLFEEGGSHLTLNAIWKDGEHNNFAYKPADGNNSWQPDHQGTTKRLIPMFGVAEAPPFTQRYNNGGFYSSGTIMMQRAMAKIEVIDHLLEQPNLEITDVTMSHYNTSGRFIPDVDANPDWNKIGAQVGTSSLPKDVAAQTGLKFFRVEESDDHDDHGTVGKWIAYVPEMALETAVFNSVGEIINDGREDGGEIRTHLNVKIDPKEGESDTGFKGGGTYKLHFARYDENFLPTIPDDSWNHILRNHIYRYYINKVGTSVRLTLIVQPWFNAPAEEWHYTHVVTVPEDGAISWQNYTNDDKEECRLIVKDDGTSAEGTFMITGPHNDIWYAYLIPLTGDPDAFYFADEEGNELSEDPHGLIDGKTPGKIYIRRRNMWTSEQNTAKLQIMVRTADNRYLEANVCPTGSGKTYYTIIQNRNIY